jgi:hypothetical protein
MTNQRGVIPGVLCGAAATLARRKGVVALCLTLLTILTLATSAPVLAQGQSQFVPAPIAPQNDNGAQPSVAASTQAGKSYLQLKQEHPGWLQIPGKLIRPDCVHEVPNGAQIEIGEDGKPTGDVTMNGEVIAHYDACPEAPIDTRHVANAGSRTPGTGNGWVEAAQWDVSLNPGDNIDLMQGFWTVPSAPSENGATIFLFNGLEPSSQSWIMQPVLQYGGSAAGGGNYWAIASWLVGSSAYHSPLENVNAGDFLFGYTEMTGTSGSDLDYKIEGQDLTTGAYSWLTVNTWGLQWTWAYNGVLEAYNVTSCAEFPSSNPDLFFFAEVTHGYPSYDSLSPGFYGATYSYGGPSCGFDAYVSGSSTDLYY